MILYSHHTIPASQNAPQNCHTRFWLNFYSNFLSFVPPSPGGKMRMGKSASFPNSIHKYSIIKSIKKSIRVDQNLHQTIFLPLPHFPKSSSGSDQKFGNWVQMEIEVVIFNVILKRSSRFIHSFTPSFNSSKYKCKKSKKQIQTCTKKVIG